MADTEHKRLLALLEGTEVGERFKVQMAEAVAGEAEWAVTIAEDAVFEALITDAIKEAAKEKIVEMFEAAGEDTDEETANEKETGEETIG